MSYPDIVLGVADGTPAAETFAARTGRELVVAEDIDHAGRAFDRRPRSCVVSAGRTLASDAMRAMATRAAATSVQLGYLLGWAGEDVAVQHAEKVSTRRDRGHAGTLVWSDFGGLPAFSGGDPATTVLARDGDVRAALTRGHRLVCVETHGNGVDAPLGSSGFLCTRRARPSMSADRGSLPCLHGGPCIRSADGGHEAERQLSPAEIRADVLVWATCWGTLGADSAFDPAASVVRYVVTDSPVSAILTTTTSVTVSAARLLLIAYLLQTGRTLGAVAGRLNRLEDGGSLAPWAVIGDPLSRAFRPGREAVTALDRREVIPPGLFRVRMPENHARDSTSVTAEGAGGEPPVVLTRWAAERDLIGLNPRREPGDLRFRTVDLFDTDDGRRLRSLWQPRDDLRFVLAFLRWTRHNPYAAAVPDPGPLENAVERAFSRQVRLSGAPLDTLVGDISRLPRLRAAEERAWQRLMTDVARFLREYVTSAGGVLSHTYQRYGQVTAVETGEPCPYCGGPVVVDRCDLPVATSSRDHLRCSSCTNIGDMPADWGEVRIDTPGPVSARTDHVRLWLRPSVPRATHTALASVTVQRVPFPVVDQVHITTLRRNDDDTLTARVPLDVRPDAPAGIYYLVASAVIDGTVVMGRRATFVDHVD